MSENRISLPTWCKELLAPRRPQPISVPSLGLGTYKRGGGGSKWRGETLEKDESGGKLCAFLMEEKGACPSARAAGIDAADASSHPAKALLLWRAEEKYAEDMLSVVGRTATSRGSFLSCSIKIKASKFSPTGCKKS